MSNVLSQVFLQLVAQLVLLLLHVSAENHSHRQGATNVKDLHNMLSTENIQYRVICAN
jgi:hypothetical protein